MKEGAQSAVAAASQSAVKEKELAAAALTFPVVSGKKQAALQPQKNPPTALQVLGVTWSRRGNTIRKAVRKNRCRGKKGRLRLHS